MVSADISRRHTCNEQRLAVAAQAVRQQTCELAVAVLNMCTPCLGVTERVNDNAQLQKSFVDANTLLKALPWSTTKGGGRGAMRG